MTYWTTVNPDKPAHRLPKTKRPYDILDHCKPRPVCASISKKDDLLTHERSVCPDQPAHRLSNGTWPYDMTAAQKWVMYVPFKTILGVSMTKKKYKHHLRNEFYFCRSLLNFGVHSLARDPLGHTSIDFGKNQVHYLYLHYFSHVPWRELHITGYSLQIFNAARQLSHIEAEPDKSGLVLLDYWFGLKWCLVTIHN